MADQVVGLRIETNGDQTVQTVKSIKKELREAQQEALNLSRKFGDTSDEAFAAAKKVALLKDEINDTKDRVELFNPGAKFAAFGGALQTVAGGFSALTGAVALFGIESKETEQALLKVQAALSISQGINSIVDAGDAMKNFGKISGLTSALQKALAVSNQLAAATFKGLGVSVATTSGAFKALRAAIITTGIGALVVGIGFLIDKLMTWSDATEDQTKQQEYLKEATDALNKSLDDELSAISRNTKISIAQAKAKGASIEELNALERKGLQEAQLTATGKVYAAKSEIDDLTTLRKKEQDAKDALLLFDLKQQEDAVNKSRAIAEKNAQASAAAVDKARERMKIRREQELQDELDAADKKQRLSESSINGKGALEIQRQLQKEQFDLEFEAKKEQLERDINLSTSVQARLAAIAELTRVTEANNTAQFIANAQAKKEAQLSFVAASLNALSGLADLVGRQTAAGKILALAEIAAGTAVGLINALDIAQKSAKATGPAAAFAFPIFYATQAAAVFSAAARAKAILSSKGTASNSVPSNAGASVTAPSIPQNAITGQTTLDRNSLNQIGNATSRAFVIESDVTNNQERVTRLNRAARLG